MKRFVGRARNPGVSAPDEAVRFRIFQPPTFPRFGMVSGSKESLGISMSVPNVRLRQARRNTAPTAALEWTEVTKTMNKSTLGQYGTKEDRP